MNSLCLAAAGFLLSINGGHAEPIQYFNSPVVFLKAVTFQGSGGFNFDTNSSVIYVVCDTNGVVVTPTNFFTINGIAGTGSVATAQAQADLALGTGATAVATISGHVLATNPHAITPAIIGAATSNQGALAETAVQVEVDPASVHTDGSGSMNGHLVMNHNKGFRIGENSNQISLSANQGDDYTGGGGHISLLSVNHGGAVQIVSYDPTGAVRRVEVYLGSDMNVPVATIEPDGFHGNGSGITGLTPEQCGSIAASNFPTPTAWQVELADAIDTNTIYITDGGGWNAPSTITNVFRRAGDQSTDQYFTNSAGWTIFTVGGYQSIFFAGPGEAHEAGDYSGSSTLPADWTGYDPWNNGEFAGLAHAEWGKLSVLVTNSIAMPATLSVGTNAPPAVLSFGAFGNLTNVLFLP